LADGRAAWLHSGSRMSGDVHVRFCEGVGVRLPRATHLLIGFENRDDSERCWGALRDRVQQCALERHPAKTRLSECGRWAAERRPGRGQGQPETFDVLGCTHVGSKTRQGKCTVRRQTSAKRRRKTLQEGKETLRRRLHWPIPRPGAWLNSVLLGPSRSS